MQYPKLLDYECRKDEQTLKKYKNQLVAGLQRNVEYENYLSLLTDI